MSGEREVKVVLLGDSGVGKSSLVHRFVVGDYEENLESTIGASFMSKSVVVDGAAVKYQIWDTAGQEKYRGLAPMYYRGAAAAIVVYDITRPETLTTARTWVDELKELGPDSIVIAVAGNKSDLESERQVSKADGEAFASSIGAIFAETSAKADVGVKGVFNEITKRLPAETESKEGTIAIGAASSKKKGCC